MKIENGLGVVMACGDRDWVALAVDETGRQFAMVGAPCPAPQMHPCCVSPAGQVFYNVTIRDFNSHDLEITSVQRMGHGDEMVLDTAWADTTTTRPDSQIFTFSTDWIRVGKDARTIAEKYFGNVVFDDAMVVCVGPLQFNTAKS